MAGADVVLLGHVVKFDPGAALAVHDALGPQDLAVLAGVQRSQDALDAGLGEGLGRLLAPAGKDLVGVVMVMVAGAVGIVALVIVVVVMMVVMFVLVVIMVVMVFVAVVVVMVMSVLSLLGLVLGPHLLQ